VESLQAAQPLDRFLPNDAALACDGSSLEGLSDVYQRKAGRLGSRGFKIGIRRPEILSMDITDSGIILGVLVALASLPLAYLAARLSLRVLMFAISTRR
jgi:hypothetical protein